ncbi:MAG TPA: hypothetical protein VKY85_21860 [Candidatus Angelobacter sp.]|nr:hypothetical protein [Candidatus Angelobacter sp.]
MKESPARATGRHSLPVDTQLEKLVHEQSAEVLIAVAADFRLTEDLALSLLNRRDLPREALEELNRNGAVIKHRKVRLTIVMHPRTPRHVSVPAIRHLYAYELMQVALFPAAAADVKRAAEETLIGRLKTISSGERFALAKQCPGRVAAALLLDEEERIMRAALSNPHMTEIMVVNAVRSLEATEILISAVCHHEKWSRRNDVKVALLRQEKTPLAKVLQFAGELPVQAVKDVLHTSRLSDNIRNYLLAVVEQRKTAARLASSS